MKHISFVLFLLSIALAAYGVAYADNSGVAINEKGAAGVCVPITTGAVVTVVGADANRSAGVTLYSTVGLNCWPGDAAGNAPSTTPTTGAIGTGRGFPIAATQYVQILSGRAVAPANSLNLALPSGDRLDCIAQTASGNVCSWGQE